MRTVFTLKTPPMDLIVVVVEPWPLAWPHQSNAGVANFWLMTTFREIERMVL